MNNLTSSSSSSSVNFRFTQDQKEVLQDFWSKGMNSCSKDNSSLTAECSRRANCSVEQVLVKSQYCGTCIFILCWHPESWTFRHPEISELWNLELPMCVCPHGYCILEVCCLLICLSSGKYKHSKGSFQGEVQYNNVRTYMYFVIHIYVYDLEC